MKIGGWSKSICAGFVCAVGLMLTGCASAQEVHAEYGFSANIPDGVTRCSYDGRDANMGFLLLLDGKACSGDGSSDGFISVTYRPNVDGKRDIADHYTLMQLSPCALNVRTEEWDGAIDGLKVAVCRAKFPLSQEPANQRIGVALSALGGRPKKDGDPPPFLYSVRLVTTAYRYESDIATFRRFVCSIDVIGDGSGSSVCAGAAN